MSSARGRIGWSCTECRRRKIKCDKTIPCLLCVKKGRSQLCMLPERTRQKEEARETRKSSMGHGPKAELDLLEKSDIGAAMTLELLATGWDVKTSHHERSRSVRSHIPKVSTGLYTPEQNESLPKGGSSSPSEKNNATSIVLIRRILTVLPPKEICDSLIHHSLYNVSWQHGGTVHVPPFMDEYNEFYSFPSDHERSLYVNPLWLSLYLSLLCAGLRHWISSPSDRERGLSADDIKHLPQRLFQSAIDALYAGNFMGEPALYSVQAVAIIVLAVQDVGSSELISTLLACSIRLCQHMDFHRLEPDDVWLAKHHSDDHFTTLFIEREIIKRVWAGLCAEDWAWFPRRSYSVIPEHCCTPLPLNLTDDDLTSGRCTERPLDEPTVATKNIVHYKMCSLTRDIYKDTLPQEGKLPIANALAADKSIRQCDNAMPYYLKAVSDISHLPPFVPSLRRWWRICTNHKLLLIHRSVLTDSFSATHLQFFRQAAVKAARSTLSEFSKKSYVPFQQVWTTVSHALAASLFVLLDLFETGDPQDQGNEVAEKRQQVLDALDMFKSIQGTACFFAERSVIVLESLLSDEQGRFSDTFPQKAPKAPNGSSYNRIFESIFHSESLMNSNAADTPSKEMDLFEYDDFRSYPSAPKDSWAVLEAHLGGSLL